MEPRFEKIQTSVESSFLFNRYEDSFYPFHWHYHPEYELVLMSQCSGHRIIGDHVGEYEESDVVLIGPNLAHSFDSLPESGNPNSPHLTLVFHFSEDFLGEGTMDRPEFLHVKSALHASKRGLLAQGKTKARTIQSIEKLQNEKGLSRLFSFISILDELGQSDEIELLASKAYTHSGQEDNQSNVDRVMEFIQENFRRDIKLDDAADRLHMSVPNFCQFFKKTTRTTFNSYLTNLRIGSACKLLIETDLTISEICFESGFNSLSNFNRRFLNTKNTTPKVFRQKFRKVRTY